jgi:hypothetical protein
MYCSHHTPRRTDAKRGMFSDAEKAIVRSAVLEYANARALETQQFDWLFKLRQKDQKGAITTIAACLPHRSRAAVYYCMRRMFHPGALPGRAGLPGPCMHAAVHALGQGACWAGQ